MIPKLKLGEVKQVHETEKFEIKAAFFEITKVNGRSPPLYHFQFHNCSLFAHHLKGHQKSFKMVLNSNLYDKDYLSFR